MAGDTKDPAIPAGGQTGLNLEQVTKVFNDSIGTALKPVTDVLKTLVESFAAVKTAIEAKPAGDVKPDAKPGADAGTKGAAVALSGEQIAELVTKQVTAALAERDKKAADGAGLEAARKNAIETHLKGVPPVYHSMLPATADGSELQAAATKAREQFQKDLAAAGVKAPNIGATAGAGAVAPGQAIDVKSAPVMSLLSSNT